MEHFIEVEDLCKTYFHKAKPIKNALQGISLQLKQKEIFGLLGANGAGKTTLSTILASLHPPTSGKVLWQGKSIYDDIISYRKMIGFCPQKPNLDQSLTLEENLIFAGKCYGIPIKEIMATKDNLMEQFQLTSYAKSIASHLSGGYKQRFLIARSLMHHPKLVILDEPTVGLDPHIRQELWKVIEGLKSQGVTVLLTTHYLDEAERLSDRVCIIDQGKVLLIDTPQNLKTSYEKKNLEDVFLHLMKENG